jgi:hypothetical protein
MTSLRIASVESTAQSLGYAVFWTSPSGCQASQYPLEAVLKWLLQFEETKAKLAQFLSPRMQRHTIPVLRLKNRKALLR